MILLPYVLESMYLGGFSEVYKAMERGIILTLGMMLLERSFNTKLRQKFLSL